MRPGVLVTVVTLTMACRIDFDPVGAAIDPVATTRVVAADVTSCAIVREGELWCWGVQKDNAPSSPFQLGASSTWRDVSVHGANPPCAIREDGTAWCWTALTADPVQIGTQTGWSSLASAEFSRCGVRAGELWCDLAAPTPVSLGTGFSSVKVGYDHACALKEDGALMCWGANGLGQLGTGTIGIAEPLPVRVGTATWRSFSIGEKWQQREMHARGCNQLVCGVQTDGTAWCWGNGDNTPMQQPGGGYTQISASKNSKCALRNTEMWCWGPDEYGAFGAGTTSSLVADPILITTGVTEVSLSTVHSCAIIDGTLQCAGAGWRGQIGDPSLWRSGPGAAAVGTFDSLAPGYDDEIGVCAMRGGKMLCWGEGGRGVPSEMANGETFTAIATGWINAPHLAVTASGQIHTATYGSPSSLWADGSFASVRFGFGHACAVGTENSLWCWGSNAAGELGINTMMDQTLPTQVGAMTYRAVSLGVSTSCALTLDDRLWCWGNNDLGQLGDGTRATHLTPTEIAPGTTWKDVSTGNYHSCAIRSDDTLWCWGNGNGGVLGTGSTLVYDTPQQVGSGAWRTVSSASDWTCGIRTDGGLWCWGRNMSGQLGTYNYVSSDVPVRVGTEIDWTDVQSYGATVCGLKSSGKVYCWGEGFEGTYGDAPAWRPTHQPVPIL